MGNTIKKNAALAVAVLLAAWVLRSIDSIGAIELGDWSLSQLLKWASFSLAGVMAAVTAPAVGDVRKRPVLNSAGLSRFAGAMLVGGALWLLWLGAKPVLVAAWIPNTQKALAIATVAVVGYAVWALYVSFDDVASALRRARPAPVAVRRPAMTHATPLPASHVDKMAYCGMCGSAVPLPNVFCGKCGTAVRSQQ